MLSSSGISDEVVSSASSTSSSVPSCPKVYGGICLESPATTQPAARPSAPIASGTVICDASSNTTRSKSIAPGAMNRASESGLTSTHGVIAAITSPYVLINERTLSPPRVRPTSRSNAATRPNTAPEPNGRAPSAHRRQHRGQRRPDRVGGAEESARSSGPGRSRRRPGTRRPPSARVCDPSAIPRSSAATASALGSCPARAAASAPPAARRPARRRPRRPATSAAAPLRAVRPSDPGLRSTVPGGEQSR